MRWRSEWVRWPSDFPQSARTASSDFGFFRQGGAAPMSGVAGLARAFARIGNAFRHGWYGREWEVCFPPPAAPGPVGARLRTLSAKALRHGRTTTAMTRSRHHVRVTRCMSAHADSYAA